MKQARLNTILVKAGVAQSRRKADELIEAKHVRINDSLATIGTKVDPEHDTITFKKKKITIPKETILIALHKPKGYDSTKEDPHAEKTVYQLLPNDLRDKVHSIGRLDKETTGLLLFTNDGQLTYNLTHPSKEHEKEYEVVVKGKISKQDKTKLQKGIRIDYKKTAPAVIPKLFYNPKTNKTHFNIILHEGRKHQVRRMCDAIKHPILSLHRIRIHKYLLGNIKEGKWKRIEP